MQLQLSECMNIFIELLLSRKQPCPDYYSFNIAVAFNNKLLLVVPT